MRVGAVERLRRRMAAYGCSAASGAHDAVEGSPPGRLHSPSAANERASVSALSNVCGGGWPLTAVLPPAVPTTRHWGPLRGRLSGLRPRTSALAGVSGLSKRVRRSLRLNLLYAGDRRMDRVSRPR